MASGPAPGASAICAECGQTVALAETIPHAGARICAACKPVFLQKLREGSQVGPRVYAGFWVRFVALIIDGIILGLFNMVLTMGLLGPLAVGAGGAPRSFAWFGVVWLIQIGTAVAYEGWFVGRFAATPGKMALRLRVVMAGGAPLTYGRAVGRYLAKMVSSFTLGIGFLIAAFDGEKRALHDMICNTRVVRV